MYHVYKVVWKPTICEKLQADQELGNKADKFAVKVVKNNKIVRPFTSRVLVNFVVFYRTWRKDMRDSTSRRRHCKQLCGGMEIPCWSVFSCLIKVKINRLK